MCSVVSRYTLPCVVHSPTSRWHCVLCARGQFAFNAFDKEGSGRLVKADFVQMCLELSANDPYHARNFARVMSSLDG